MNKGSHDDAVTHVEGLLVALGFTDYKDDPNMVDTPRRVARAMHEMCKGSYDTEAQVSSVMTPLFPCGYDEMIVVRDIQTVGICPHHFFPVMYKSVLAYVPSVNGNVIGISKLPRLVDILSSRPVLQEQLVVDVVDNMTRYLQPSGVGFTLVGGHGCMQCRGIKMRDSDTVTTKLTGVIRDNSASRAEFMQYVKGVLSDGAGR